MNTIKSIYQRLVPLNLFLWFVPFLFLTTQSVFWIEYLKTLVFVAMSTLGLHYFMPQLFKLHQQNISWKNNIKFYLALVLGAAALILGLQMVKFLTVARPLIFSLLLVLLFLQSLKIKLELQKYNHRDQTIINFLYFFCLVTLSFFLVSEIKPLALGLLSLVFALNATGLNAIQRLEPSELTITKLRISLILTIAALGPLGLLALGNLISTLFFVVFFLVPVLIKILPNPKDPLAKLNYQTITKQILRYNYFFFLALILVRITNEFWHY